MAQKVILIALLAIGALCLIVGLSLMHHIGGFLRTVEEEAREKEQMDDSPEAGDAPSGNETSTQKNT